MHRFFRFESWRNPVISRVAFALRLTRNFLAAIGLIGASLFAGMVGYHYLEDLSWIDSFANASMILSGMGPLADMKTNAGKLFAGCYALYSGLALILIAGIVFAPMVHRLMHRFHLEDDE